MEVENIDFSQPAVMNRGLLDETTRSGRKKEERALHCAVNYGRGNWQKERKSCGRKRHARSNCKCINATDDHEAFRGSNKTEPNSTSDSQSLNELSARTRGGIH